MRDLINGPMRSATAVRDREALGVNGGLGLVADRSIHRAPAIVGTRTPIHEALSQLLVTWFKEAVCRCRSEAEQSLEVSS